MPGKEIDSIEPAAEKEPRYGEELLEANWNPVVALLARSCSITTERVTRDAMSDSDIDGFLTRFYTLGA